LEEDLTNRAKHRTPGAASRVGMIEPGPHPDEFDPPGSGWPDHLKRFASEAWQREEAGELTEQEMYPSDATWAGLYDQMLNHTVEETTRRSRIAAEPSQHLLTDCIGKIVMGPSEDVWCYLDSPELDMVWVAFGDKPPAGKTARRPQPGRVLLS
jgi:hypothetical protein